MIVATAPSLRTRVVQANDQRTTIVNPAMSGYDNRPVGVARHYASLDDPAVRMIPAMARQVVSVSDVASATPTVVASATPTVVASATPTVVASATPTVVAHGTASPTTTLSMRSEAVCEALLVAGEKNLSYCQFKNLDFGNNSNETSLYEYDFRFSVLENVRFTQTNLIASNLQYARLVNVEFNIFYDLRGNDFTYATCKCVFTTREGNIVDISEL